MKKLILLMLTLALLSSVCYALAETADTVPAPLTSAEVREAVDFFHTLALGLEPISAECSEDEDGARSWTLEYDFGYIHTADEKLTEDSVIYDVSVLASEYETIRGTYVGAYLTETLQSFKCDNAGFAGDRYGALLSLDGTPDAGFSASMLSRDGQDIIYVMWQVTEPNKDKFLNDGMICYIDGGFISGVELYISDDSSPEDVSAAWQMMAELDGMDDYVAVETNYSDGTVLEPFCEEDLVFSGIDFLNDVSESLPDLLDEVMIDNGDGTFLHRVDGVGYTAILLADENKCDLSMLQFTILSDDIEGPRGLRLGDDLVGDRVRFHYEDTDFDYENMTQILYGDGVTAPCGVSVYGTDGSAELRYLLCTEDDREILLLLTYSCDEKLLTGITVKVL